MRMLSTFTGIVIALLMFVQTSMAAIEIVATVNSQPITNYDLEQRATFIQRATNIEVTDDNRQRLFDDALQMLIDDTLKVQAAEALRSDIKGLALPRAKELVDEAFGTAEKSGSQILRSRQIDPLTVQSKYLADLVWSDFLRTEYAEKFEGIEEKIDVEIERLIANASQPQLRLSEIVLSPGPTRSYKQTLELANKMVPAIRKGADFAAIAEQYSAAGTRQQGGRIGWVVTNRLPADFREVLEKMQNGAITDPIELDGAIYIFKREGNREKGLADESQARIWLARAILPLASDASNPDRLEAAAKIERDSKNLDNCDDIVALHDSYQSNAVARLNEMIFADLAPQMQRLVTELDDNMSSEPLAFAEGVAVFMVCRREKPKIELPTRDEIESAQIDKLFGTISERHLIRLRRTAVIDIRN